MGSLELVAWPLPALTQPFTVRLGFNECEQ